MNQQQLEDYLQRYKNILKQIKDEVKKLQTKQEEITELEQNILQIKDNTNKILNILQGNHEPSLSTTKYIHTMPKAMTIKHKENVSSVIELTDSKIVTGDYKGCISLFSIDYVNDKWEKLKELQGHDDCINSLCELSNNRVVSSSGDNTLKVWTIDNNTITHIKTLGGSSSIIYQVIPLTNDIIAFGLFDKKIKIVDVTTYKEILSLDENFAVCSLLKLKNKEIMASSGYGNCVSFWRTNSFHKECSVGCCDCYSYNGLLELPDDCIAVSGGGSLTIDIINVEFYQRIKQITCEWYITSSDFLSSLCLLNNGTFIYSHEGSFCQMSSTTYEIIYKTKMEEEFLGFTLISALNGKYIIASNEKKEQKGITIFKVGYV